MIGFPSSGGLVPSGVTATTALGLSAVWRCIDILSNGVSQLPWQERRGNLELPPSRLVRAPLGYGTRREWVSYVVSVLALYDVCYLLKVGGDDSEGAPIGLLPIDPGQVMPRLQSVSVSPFLVPDEFYVGTSIVPADRLVILHRSPIPGAMDGTSGIIHLARTTFAAAIAAEGYASRYWQGGGSPNVVLETDTTVPPTERTRITDAWQARRAKGPDYAPLLDGGIKARDFGADPTAAAAVEARREQVADIGRYFGIGSSLLNAPNQSSQTYSTTEAEGIHLTRFTLTNYVQAIEDAISGQLPGGRRLCIETEALTRSSQLSQAQAMQLATGGKAWLDVDEARELWGLPPIESPDTLNPPAPAPVMVTPGGMSNE